MDFIFFQGFNIQGLFMLFLLVTIIVLSIILIARHKKEKKDENNFMSWVEKKDILYWLLIICLGSISVITYEYSGDQDALSHWSFAGTIVSIILAIVAIGFTLYQTLSSSLSSDKITTSAENIKTSADKIVKVSDELNSSDLIKAGEIITSVSKNILDYNSQIKLIKQQLTQELDAIKNTQMNSENNIKSLLSKIESSSLDSGESIVPNEDFISIDIKHFFLTIIPSFKPYPIFFIYSYFFLLDNRMTLEKYDNQQEFVMQLAKKKYNENKNENEEYKVELLTYLGLFLGSFSTCKTFIQAIGVEQSFNNLDDVNRKELLKSVEKSISNDLIDFLNSFKNNSE